MMLIISVSAQAMIQSTLTKVPTNTGIVATRPVSNLDTIARSPIINQDNIVKYPIINPGANAINPVILGSTGLHPVNNLATLKQSSYTVIKPTDKGIKAPSRNEMTPEALHALKEYRKEVLQKEMNSRILQKDSIIFGPNPNHDNDHWMRQS
jgi:hypothetical protein